MPEPRDWLKLRPWQRHSLVLTVAGIVYVLVGLSYLITPDTPQRQAGLWVVLAHASIQVWAALWILVGLCAIVSARWPSFAESWGYVALTTLGAGWSAVYLVALIFHGYYAAVFGVLIWGVLAFLWWAISGLRNPVPEPHVWIDADALESLAHPDQGK